MSNYLLGIWNARYFWFHLAMSDLRTRWRRSFFGIFWSILQPLCLTILVSIVFSKLFNQEIREYAPYILSGLVIWDFLTSTIVGGSLAFVQADAYIKQTRHPLAIYTLRNCVSSLVVMALASLALIGWVIVVLPSTFGWHWLAVVTVYPLILLICWPISTVMAYIGARYRDLPNALQLILQALWFVSPVYFLDSMFRNGGLHWFVDYNPIYHLMQIVRAPLLSGTWPTLTNYVWCLATFIVAALIAIAMGTWSEKRVIYYL